MPALVKTEQPRSTVSKVSFAEDIHTKGIVVWRHVHAALDQGFVAVGGRGFCCGGSWGVM